MFSIHAQTTTEGTDFWFGYMQNFDGGSPSSVEIFITSKVSTRGEIAISTNGARIQFEVEPGQTYRRIINREEDNSFAASGSGSVERKAIHVTSEEPVSVYAFNNRSRSADAAVIFPTESLGNKYFVSSIYEPDNRPTYSEFLVVAAYNNTVIEITPTQATVDGKPANEKFEITLDQGEVYQLQAAADLSGSLIQSDEESEECVAFAVFSGHMWATVTQENCDILLDFGQGPALNSNFAPDQLYEQLLPFNSWGKEYVVTPLSSREGYVLQVVAGEDNTQVNISGRTFTLNEGDYITRPESGLLYVSSNNPIQVAQFAQSGGCDALPGVTYFWNNGNVQPDVIGDPFMIMLSPLEQRLKEVTFNALNAQETTDYFVNIIVPTSSTGSTTLNGNTIPSFEWRSIFNTGFSYTSVDLAKGDDYTLKSDEGFIAYVYAFGTIESFGYSAGASIENLNIEIQGNDEFIGEIVNEACVDAIIDFEAAFDTEPGQEPRYDTFSWDFGDGNTADGQMVQHTYAEPGEYVVTILASKGSTSCGNSETLNRTIVVTDTEVEEIVGPVSVCPDVTGIAYTIQGAEGNTYQWEVSGGTLVSGQGTNEITVDWGPANNTSFVKVTPFNSFGCQSDPQTLDVIINKRLEPAPPRSSSPQPGEVCYLDRNRIRYFTPPTAGSEYEWFIEGGTFTSDSNIASDEVFVDWGSSTSGRIWYREFNPLISDCEGFSDTVSVVIHPEIIESGIVIDALCNGDSNGSVVLTIEGGKGSNYTVNWDNGMTGASIDGLNAGEYTATITDELGCEITSQVYTVGHPDVLEFVNMGDVLDVRCFEESNGEISVSIQGGTAPYSFAWSGMGINRTTDVPMITGLKTGTYDVVATDVNGCSALLEGIFVDEPLLLQADIESLINDPVCPQAENGTAFIDAKGGTPDYQFYWSNDPTTDNQEATGLSKGEYTVRIVDANGCEATYPIEKGERDPKVFIPNAFSPNGDGINDEFKPVADCQVVYSMQIFNKWGTIVFSTTDITEGWDGTFNGGPVQYGKYSYVIFWAATINGVKFEENIRGSLNIYK